MARQADASTTNTRGGWMSLLVAVGLTAGGALIAWIVDGKYAWLGAMIGGVTGAFAPTIYDTLTRRGRAREAMKTLREITDFEDGRAQPAAAPSRLLDPRLAVVGFEGRRQELRDLVAWCEHDSTGRVRLVTGPGGVGKSRLAVELCSQLEALGWRCIWLADGTEQTAVATVRAATSDSVLLVVDYAEARTGLNALLRAVLTDGAAALRVLLLARSAGEWWERLGASEPGVRALVAQADPAALTAVVERDVSDAELVQRAVRAFATRLDVKVPRVVDPARPGRSQILELHAAALVAVLDAQQQPSDMPVAVTVDGVVTALLDHEKRFWVRTAERAGLDSGPLGLTLDGMRRIIAAGSLLGAANRQEAMALIQQANGGAATEKVANWLRDLYPPTGSETDPRRQEWLGALQPDRLAEHHIVVELTADHDLAEACLTNLNDRQARRALTLLGRASADYPEAIPLLQRLLPMLEHVIAELDSDLDTLIALANAIPSPSVLMAETHAAIARRIVDDLDDGDLTRRAAWLNTLGLQLDEIGRADEALPALEEAVKIRRNLVAIDADRHLPELAASLSNMGITHSHLGDLDKALEEEQEAVEIRRRLVKADADRYRAGLARSLTNLGVRLGNFGRTDEALEATQEAVDIRRRLVQASPDRHWPDLALSLQNLGQPLFELGRFDEALAAVEEAASVFRELANLDPDRHLPTLASMLSNRAATLSRFHRPSEALMPAQEAVAIRRTLASRFPARYRSGLAVSLGNLAGIYHALDQPALSLGPARESASIFRNLTEANPGRYAADLGVSAALLSELSGPLAARGWEHDAGAVSEEAVKVFRYLMEIDPEQYRDGLAYALTNLAVSVGASAQKNEAEKYAREAVKIFRELAEKDVEGYRPELAASLSNLAAVLNGLLRRPAEALPVAREAVRIRRRLFESDPEEYRLDLAASLNNLDSSCAALGADHRSERAAIVAELAITLVGSIRQTEAESTAQEAVRICQELVREETDRYRPELAAAMSNLGKVLCQLDRPLDAEPVMQETVALWRQLDAADPDQHRAGLAHALDALASLYAELGREGDAEAARGEAALLTDQA